MKVYWVTCTGRTPALETVAPILLHTVDNNHPTRRGKAGRKEVMSSMFNPIDETFLIDQDMPATWKCPHCGKRNQSGMGANEILIEHGKYIQHCENCGYLHYWELKLTEKIKQEVIKYLVNRISCRPAPAIEREKGNHDID